MTSALSIAPAQSDADFAAVRVLLDEYRDTVLIEDYVIAESELEEDLAEIYQPPQGIFLLARMDDRICGFFGLRAFEGRTAELKRMYVTPDMRGRGIAESLARGIIAWAQELGYTRLYLDSLKRLTNAHRLYEKLGFTYCAPYDPTISDRLRDNVVFMTMELEEN